jgi:branched-chain amino acid transport system permease protein
MEFFIQLIVGGLSVGGTYALVALGFVLIFGVANVLNIAHAQSIMLAPFFIFILMDQAKLPAALALPQALILTVVIALIVYSAAIRPFLVAGRQSGYLAPFIGSFGVSLFIENILAKIFGSSPHPFPIEIPRNVWRLGSIVFVPMQIVSMACVVIAALVLAWVVRRSKIGRSMRAVAENPIVAESMGISARRTIIITITIATVLGAVSGILFAAGNNELSPFMGMEYGLKGLVVMIIGGVTSLPGAVVAGLLLGIAEALAVGYLSSSFSMVISFGLLFVILLARPTGLFASASRESRP